MFSSNVMCGTQALWLLNIARSGWLLTSPEAGVSYYKTNEAFVGMF